MGSHEPGWALYKSTPEKDGSAPTEHFAWK